MPMLEFLLCMFIKLTNYGIIKQSGDGVCHVCIPYSGPMRRILELPYGEYHQWKLLLLFHFRHSLPQRLLWAAPDDTHC